MNDEYMSRFDGVETLTDIYSIARQLKAEGVEAVVVNDYVTRVKKRLVAKSAGIHRINRIPIMMEEAPTQPITQFFIKIEYLNRPLIMMTERGEITL